MDPLFPLLLSKAGVGAGAPMAAVLPSYDNRIGLLGCGRFAAPGQEPLTT
jgi:hypothetical protein